MSHPDVEIVGLEAAENLRSCPVHRICGTVVEIGSLLRFKFTVVESKHEVDQLSL